MILKILDKENYSIVNLDNVDILDLKFFYNMQVNSNNQHCYNIVYQQMNLPESRSFYFAIPSSQFENIELGRKILDCILDMSWYSKGIIDLNIENYWIEEFKNEDWITIGGNQIIIDLTLK